MKAFLKKNLGHAFVFMAMLASILYKMEIHVPLRVWISVIVLLCLITWLPTGILRSMQSRWSKSRERRRLIKQALPLLKLIPEDSTEEDFKAFFTTEVIAKRLLICSAINNDLLDDWGISGYQPGFIFIEVDCNPGRDDTFADLYWNTGTSIKSSISPTGFTVHYLSHYDFFPRGRFFSKEITSGSHPRTFSYLQTLLQVDCAGKQKMQGPESDMFGALAGVVQQNKLSA